ncbi:porin, partial [Synechococcus sp. YX-04-1]|nr:porin [Synechococcus sp. YX-04-1]
MTLVRQLLMAPAALGLLATGANAAELNINGVSDYAATSSGNSLDQVTSVTQFSDVYPTDWAYQALANL